MKKKNVLILLLAITLICVFPQLAFADDIQYANILNKLGLFLGTNNGYDLELPCDRLMGAVLLTRFLGLEAEALAVNYTHPFTDVRETYADKYIALLYTYGLVQGQSSESYGRGPMSGNQFATLMLRSLAYREGVDFTWNNALSKLLELEIVSSAELTGFSRDGFLRADAVFLCYKVLYAIPPDGYMPLVHKLLWDDVFTVYQLDATKDGALMIAADTPGIITDDAVVYNLQDAKKLTMLALKNAQNSVVIRMPGFTERERLGVVDDLLSEFRSYGQLFSGEAIVTRDTLSINVEITKSYMMENYYKDPARYQKHHHFTYPPLIADNEYYTYMVTWVNKMNEILAEYITDDMSEKEKVKALHDYLILNTTYDDLNGDSRVHMPYTVFIERKGVCDAYAEAFKILMNAAGLECIVVPGSAMGEGHVWNQVKVDGLWYHIDVTWDDPDYGDLILYDYFCIPDSKIYKDHSVEEGFTPYICDAPALIPKR